MKSFCNLNYRIVHNLEEIYSSYNAIKLQSQKLLTNVYTTSDYFGAYLVKGVQLFTYGNSSLILVPINYSYFKVFFFADDLVSLDLLLSDLPTKNSYLIEFLDDTNPNLISRFSGQGFKKYEVLHFMEKSLNLETVQPSLQDITLAKFEDCEDIRNKIIANFDDGIDDFPNFKQLSEFIKNGTVLLVKNSLGCIEAFLIYKRFRNHVKVYFLFVDLGMRKFGFGSELLRHLIVKHGLPLKLWVKESNVSAQQFYLKKGFVRLNSNRIFLRKSNET